MNIYNWGEVRLFLSVVYSFKLKRKGLEGLCVCLNMCCWLYNYDDTVLSIGHKICYNSANSNLVGSIRKRPGSRF